MRKIKREKDLREEYYKKRSDINGIEDNKNGIS